jgi:hypothetical protein
MAHREFIDQSGVRWQAWEVIPTTAERRAAGERRFGARDKRDRRTQQQFRVQLDDGLEKGWLAFESPTEKRRLHPIPPDWADRSDEELAALCGAAEVAPRVAPRPTE